MQLLNSKNPYLRIYFIVASLFTIYNTISYKEIFFQGRFLAEEGTLFWAHAINSGIVKHIIYIQPLSGYYLLLTNIITGISSLLPVKYAPLFTSWFSSLIMTTPALIFAILNPKNLLHRTKIALLCTFIFGNCINTSETFANSINSQIYLAATCGVLALFWKPSNYDKKTNITIFLFVCFSLLNGWYSFLFLPFILRNIWKTSFKFKLILCSGIALIIQFWSLIYLNLNNLLYPRMERELSVTNYLQLYIKIFYNTFNGELSQISFKFSNIAISLNKIFAISAFLLLLLLGAEIFQDSHNKYLKKVLLQSILMLVICSSFVFIGSADKIIGGRYLVIPSFIVQIIAILMLSERHKNLGLIGKSSLAILLFALLVNTNLQNFYKPNIFLRCERACVSWNSQLEKIHLNQQSKYFFWPMTHENPWYVNSKSPRPRLAKFQEAALKT